MLLGLVPAEAKFFTCPDLKDAPLSASAWLHRASLFLPSNGKILTLGKRDS
jgi:hypothetical protein